MRISIEGPEIDAVEFEGIFVKNIIIEYYFDCVVGSYCCKLMSGLHD